MSSILNEWLSESGKRAVSSVTSWCPAPALALLLAVAPAAANEPTGEWIVEKGIARVKIDNCGGTLWGVISWEKNPGGRDENNPDPTKRDRPTFGLPILLDMKPGSGAWEGEVYNAENGKRYSSKISLSAPDTLRIQGCVLGFLCGGENWTRFSGQAERVDVCSIVGRAPAGNRGMSSTGSRPAGPAHERRLKEDGRR